MKQCFHIIFNLCKKMALSLSINRCSCSIPTQTFVYIRYSNEENYSIIVIYVCCICTLYTNNQSTKRITFSISQVQHIMDRITFVIKTISIADLMSGFYFYPLLRTHRILYAECQERTIFFFSLCHYLCTENGKLLCFHWMSKCQ